MVILFLVALFLAWPTAGLSIVAYIGFIVLRGYLKGKSRVHHANIRHAERAIASGSRRWPSWTKDNDKSWVFLEAIQQGAMRDGVPRSFLQGILVEQGNAEGLYFFAGALEEEGASFLEQQIACSEKLVEMWNSTSHLGRTTLMSKGFKAASEASRRQQISDFDDEIPF